MSGLGIVVSGEVGTLALHFGELSRLESGIQVSDEVGTLVSDQEDSQVSDHILTDNQVYDQEHIQVSAGEGILVFDQDKQEYDQVSAVDILETVRESDVSGMLESGQVEDILVSGQGMQVCDQVSAVRILVSLQ